jgi:glyoxylase-like metal-dependent hydrolase (beta-lactamase superfamily II)
MKEVLPGIFQINLTLSGFNPDSVNIYLIKTTNGYWCIDTGWDSPPAIQSLEEQLEEAGVRLTDINHYILTHGHIDHLGMIPRFKTAYNPTVYLHEKEVELLKIRFSDGDQFLTMTDRFLQSHGFPAAELTPPEFQLPISEDLSKIKPDIPLRGDEEIKVGDYILKVINTPGHTPGHIALYEPRKKFLFSGDVLLPTIDTNAAFHVQLIEYPIQKYLNSLATLRKLEIEKVLPGHEYVFSDPHRRIDEIFRNHEQKSAVIFKAFSDKQPKTAYNVSRWLARSSRKHTDYWDKMTGWDRRFAVLQTIAYLESLRFDEKIKLEIKDGVNIYQLA